MYQTGDTIQDTLTEIQKGNLVLPAIQREFVWQPEQMYRLFDSLMQGYPFGTFLFWRVESQNSAKYNFYDFVLNYHERDHPHCPRLPMMSGRQLTAVLDGQQRLTALNIGLRGSMAWKRPRVWRNNPRAFPVRRLHLDLLWRPIDDDDEGLKYRFQFLTHDQLSDSPDEVCWFPVSEILAFEKNGPPLTRWLNERLEQSKVDAAHETLDDLYQVVRNRRLIAFYEEKSQKLEKVLQIFIRMNQGGTPLSHSDLLLSVAAAQWTQHHAREEIHALVDDLNRIGGVGFSITKDLVLKAGLMLSGIGSVEFKVENFNNENMEIFQNDWTEIKRALTLTVQLISTFGFNGQNLSAHNSILPIAYYIYRKRPADSYLTVGRLTEERRVIKEWLVRSLLKAGIWGSGLDTLLTALRRIIAENGDDGFPTPKIREEMTRRGKSLTFEDEEIEDLCDMQYSDSATFALLSLIFPFVDLANQFHVDHIFPKAGFTKRKLKDVGVQEEKIEQYLQTKDRLSNLQLLVGAVNNEKQTSPPAAWLSQTYRDPATREEYQLRHMLGQVPESMVDFEDFYISRRDRLRSRIEELLGRLRTSCGRQRVRMRCVRSKASHESEFLGQNGALHFAAFDASVLTIGRQVRVRLRAGSRPQSPSPVRPRKGLTWKGACACSMGRLPGSGRAWRVETRRAVARANGAKKNSTSAATPTLIASYGATGCRTVWRTFKQVPGARGVRKRRDRAVRSVTRQARDARP